MGACGYYPRDSAGLGILDLRVAGASGIACEWASVEWFSVGVKSVAGGTDVFAVLLTPRFAVWVISAFGVENKIARLRRRQEDFTRAFKVLVAGCSRKFPIAFFQILAAFAEVSF